MMFTNKHKLKKKNNPVLCDTDQEKNAYKNKDESTFIYVSTKN